MARKGPSSNQVKICNLGSVGLLSGLEGPKELEAFGSVTRDLGSGRAVAPGFDGPVAQLVRAHA